MTSELGAEPRVCARHEHGAKKSMADKLIRLTRMLMSRMLTRLGHQVTTAENGRVALDLINDSYQGRDPKFDVVFLDK